MTIPNTFSDAYERIFVTIRYIEIWFRTSMLQDRFATISLLYVEKIWDFDDKNRNTKIKWLLLSVVCHNILKFLLALSNKRMCVTEVGENPARHFVLDYSSSPGPPKISTNARQQTILYRNRILFHVEFDTWINEYSPLMKFASIIE